MKKRKPTKKFEDKSQIEIFRELLEIDRNNLDDALITQSELFFKVSEAQVLAAASADALKEGVAMVDADLDAVVRQQLDDAGEKDTVAKVQAGINSHEDHITAVDEWLETKREADMLRAMKDSFSMRSSMLKNLVELVCTQYYTVESIRGPSEEAGYTRNRARIAQDKRSKRDD